jgi:hypothetical protein
MMKKKQSRKFKKLKSLLLLLAWVNVKYNLSVQLRDVQFTFVLQNKSDNSNGHALIGQQYCPPCTSKLSNPDGASKQIGQQYCPPCTSKLSNLDGASKQIGQQ